MPQTAPSKSDSVLARLTCEAAEIELPPLSTVALEVGRLAADNDAADSAGALSNIIRRDVALATQIIRVANSALYSPRVPIVSLAQAVTRLGMNEIRNIAYSFALRTNLLGGAAFAALWRESLATACFAQEVARIKRRDVESAYLCGLMHRVGFAVLLWRLARSSDCQLVDAESLTDFAAQGAEAKVGLRLAQAWQLPPAIGAAIAHWRSPTEAPANYRSLLMQIVTARALTTQLNAADDLAPELSGIDPAALEVLALYPDDVRALFAKRPLIRSAVECYT